MGDQVMDERNESLATWYGRALDLRVGQRFRPAVHLAGMLLRGGGYVSMDDVRKSGVHTSSAMRKLQDAGMAEYCDRDKRGIAGGIKAILRAYRATKTEGS